MASVGVRGLASLHPSWVPWQAWCGVCASRRIWQWYVPCWFCFPSVVVGVLAGMDQKGRYSYMYKVGIYGDSSRCVLFPGRQAQDARHLGRFGPEEQLLWHVQDWFHVLHLALFPFPWFEGP